MYSCRASELKSDQIKLTELKEEKDSYWAKVAKIQTIWKKKSMYDWFPYNKKVKKWTGFHYINRDKKKAKL